MTYNLINGSPVRVRSIRYDGRRIANPPDDLVVQLVFRIVRDVLFVRGIKLVQLVRIN